jgi:hypothetical protein
VLIAGSTKNPSSWNDRICSAVSLTVERPLRVEGGGFGLLMTFIPVELGEIIFKQIASQFALKPYATIRPKSESTFAPETCGRAPEIVAKIC